jgi:hypothetical protein
MERSSRHNPLDPLGRGGAAHQQPQQHHQQQQQPHQQGFLERHEGLIFAVHVALVVLIALLALRLVVKRIVARVRLLLLTLGAYLSPKQQPPGFKRD